MNVSIHFTKMCISKYCVIGGIHLYLIRTQNSIFFFSFSFFFWFFVFFPQLPLFLNLSARLNCTEKESRHASVFFVWVPYTVHGTHKYFFSAKTTLKLGPTALFTHLKLFCYSIFSFQFSVISGIQIDPKRVKGFCF